MVGRRSRDRPGLQDNVSVVLIVLVALCCGYSSGVAASEGLRFLVLGDWGGLPYFPFRTFVEVAVADQIGAFAQANDAQFVLALGDNFYYEGVTCAEDKRFLETFEWTFTAPSLNVPWYLVAGNHDYNGNVSAQVEYSKLSKRWNYPDLYYQLKFPIPGTSSSMELLMIDTVQLCGNSDDDFKGKQPMGADDEQLAGDQWQWLEDKLKASTAEYLIVAGHYPVLSIAEHGPTAQLVDQLMPMLYKYKATAYFSGHDHNLQHLQYTSNNHTLEYFVSGAANFIDPSLAHVDSVPANSSKFHWANIFSLGGFGYVHSTANNMTFQFVEANHKLLYEKTVLPRKV